MSLDEYKRKRRFEETPEPPPKLEKQSRHRFVVQRHAATRLHYDFRLEMEGVLKSWAVPKGPSLDPADKRLAMQVEDHPVSYFDFEGTIPKGNYGGGTVMVWDAGTWEPLSPVPVNGDYVPGTEKEAAAMLAKGDLKFRLKGKRLKGDFAIVHIKGRSGSKGNEWLLIKKKDDHVVTGFDIDAYDTSILTNRTMAQIAGDEGSAEWTSSRPASRGKVKAAWLADAIARADSKRKASTAESAEAAEKQKKARSPGHAARGAAQTKKSSDDATSPNLPRPNQKARNPLRSSASSAVKTLAGAEERPMPTVIHPMLAESTAKAFDNPDWLFEIKWDGYRAVAFIEDGRVRLVSRNQNDLTKQFHELGSLPQFVKAQRAILDGEIVALDEEGRPSFSLMQQRTGFQPGKRRLQRREGVPVIYYAFDLLYLDGLDLRRVALEQRKQLLQERIVAGVAGEAKSFIFPTTMPRRVLIFLRRQSSADWRASLPRSVAALTRKGGRAIGSKSKSRSVRSASLEAIPIRRGAANISGRSCLACTTATGASFTLDRWHRLRSEDTQRNLRSAAAAEDETESVLWRDWRIAKSSLRASGTGCGNQVRRVDARNRGGWDEVAGPSVHGSSIR